MKIFVNLCNIVSNGCKIVNSSVEKEKVMETRWLYVTSENFAKLREESKKTCVIPMGCVEKHGLHLPLGTDILKANHLVYEASKLETVCVFPDFTFGDICIGSHKNKPDGTISPGVELEMKLLETLCDQIAENGFEKILVMNGHGGNTSWLATFSRNLGMRPHKFVFAYMNTPSTAPHKMAELLIEKGTGAIPELTKEDEAYILKCHEDNILLGHACLHEAAHMIGFAPESVHLERLGIESGKTQKRENLEKLRKAGIKIASNGWSYEYPNWYQGDDPSGCNERIGKASLRMSIEMLAEAYKVFKDDEYLVKWEKAKWKNGDWK